MTVQQRKKETKIRIFRNAPCIPGKGKGYELAGGGEDDACVEGADDYYDHNNHYDNRQTNYEEDFFLK